MKWGFGLEHEAHFFHMPNKNKPIKDFVLFNYHRPIEIIIKLYDNGKLKLATNMERIILDNIGKKSIMMNEVSGRKSAGNYILKPLPIDMAEFITDNPTSCRTIEEFCDELLILENNFIRILTKYHKFTKRKIDKYGQIIVYPFGMSSLIRVPKNLNSISNIYYFQKKLYKDYTGSFHITMTLPYDEHMTQNEFLRNHQNFGNQIQWIEPLLVAGFFSADQMAVWGTGKRRIKGSFRVVRVGWGNFAGTDVRKFNKGVGRYANIISLWRRGLLFHEMEKLDSLEKATKYIQQNTPDAVSAYSSNMRTVGSSREVGPQPIRKGKGFELRIFDNFDPIHLKELGKFLMYLAENSRITETKKYVYNDRDWINALQDIMMKGWKAELKTIYIKKLERHLGIKLKINSYRAYDVLLAINEALYKKNRAGKWTKILIKHRTLPQIPDLNRQSLDLSFCLKMNRNKIFYKKFMNFLIQLQENLLIKEFQKEFLKEFGKDWKYDWEDVMWFLEKYEIIKINKTQISIDREQILGLTDVNKYITPLFQRERYEVKSHDMIQSDFLIRGL